MAILGDSKITKVETKEVTATKISIGEDTNNASANTGTQLEIKGDAKINLLDLIYPVGSIYVYQKGTAAPTTCPIQDTLGGTWDKIEDEFLYSSSDDDFYGTHGGSNNGYLVKHSHEAGNKYYSNTTWSAGTHTHDFIVHKNGWHTDAGNESVNRSIDAFDIGWEWGTKVPENSRYRGDSSYPLIGRNGSHSHTFSITAGTLKTETTNTTTDTGGDIIDSGIDKANMPKYFGVIAWRRTK